MKYIKYAAIGITLILAIVVIYLAYGIFSAQSSIEEDQTITIPTGSDIDDVYALLNEYDIYIHEGLFHVLSDKMHYSSKVRAGRYKIEAGSSLLNIIRKLRSGAQETVPVTIHLENTPEDIAGKVSRYLEFDSTYYNQAFSSDSLLNQYNIDRSNFMSYVIPETYFMYYNSSAETVLKRLIDERNKFWNKDNRLEKASRMNMTEHEVYTLASIVERESQYKSERPRIAGVYLNRLEKGIPLQADPTVIYAMENPNINRVLKKYLEVESPYNTYKYAGLPPGPIGTASISSIDAVLNSEKHEYYYFCAKADNSGEHVFAKTLNQHLQNARKFQQWLNSRNIYR